MPSTWIEKTYKPLWDYYSFSIPSTSDVHFGDDLSGLRARRVAEACPDDNIISSVVNLKWPSVFPFLADGAFASVVRLHPATTRSEYDL